MLRVKPTKQGQVFECLDPVTMNTYFTVFIGDPALSRDNDDTNLMVKLVHTSTSRSFEYAPELLIQTLVNTKFPPYADIISGLCNVPTRYIIRPKNIVIRLFEVQKIGKAITKMIFTGYTCKPTEYGIEYISLNPEETPVTVTGATPSKDPKPAPKPANKPAPAPKPVPKPTPKKPVTPVDPNPEVQASPIPKPNPAPPAPKPAPKADPNPRPDLAKTDPPKKQKKKPSTANNLKNGEKTIDRIINYVPSKDALEVAKDLFRIFPEYTIEYEGKMFINVCTLYEDLRLGNSITIRRMRKPNSACLTPEELLTMFRLGNTEFKGYKFENGFHPTISYIHRIKKACTCLLQQDFTPPKPQITPDSEIWKYIESLRPDFEKFGQGIVIEQTAKKFPNVTRSSIKSYVARILTGAINVNGPLIEVDDKFTAAMTTSIVASSFYREDIVALMDVVKDQYSYVMDGQIKLIDLCDNPAVCLIVYLIIAKSTMNIATWMRDLYRNEYMATIIKMIDEKYPTVRSFIRDNYGAGYMYSSSSVINTAFFGVKIYSIPKNVVSRARKLQNDHHKFVKYCLENNCCIEVFSKTKPLSSAKAIFIDVFGINRENISKISIMFNSMKGESRKGV